MRLCGGFGRAGALVGAFFLSSGLSACLGPTTQPQEYTLGAAGSGDAGGLVAEASARVDSASRPAGSTQFAAAGDVVYFDSDSSELSPAAKAILRRQIRWLRAHPDHRILVEGHADEWGDSQHNLMLGAERAVAVKTYLESNGVHAASIPTVSYGRERLAANCEALSCRARNRRARTVVSLPPNFR
ncbi:OmpA family protein [Methyloceanibacter sp. wino2]|uniref:OmpA family protein n=1 Tax=Methyloceanibacter sp. wino2 TaxID=2170729 RepID=UPI000D3E4152|nr:OmpA family protein [Methyloceanibacter sp. wino2]